MSALVVALGAALLVAGQASAATRTDVIIPSTDATKLAATLVLPDGTPPAGGWPAVVILHGLGGDRSSSLALSDSMGLEQRFAVLAFDARGHGQSGGLIGIDGPREIADTQAVFAWLRDRPEVSDTRIGGFGTSYGGGALWNSLAAGTPWATLAVNITWTDLRSALMPQDLVKSGVVAGLLGSLPPDRVDPEVLAIRDAAFISGNIAPIVPWGARRSSLASLKGVKTPVLMMQGRGTSSSASTRRSARGRRSQAPSDCGSGCTAMRRRASRQLTRRRCWRRPRRGSTAPSACPGRRPLDPRPVAISPESWSGAPVRMASLPKVRRTSFDAGRARDRSSRRARCSARRAR